MTEMGTAKNPIFMKILHDDDGNLSLRKIAIALAVTALTGYLASRSQRAGSGIDFDTQIRMRLALTGERLGREITRLGCAVSIWSSRAYDKAVPC